MRNALCLLYIIVTVTLLSGFTLPSSHQLRKEFKAEIEKIRERTPGAKALANWKRLKQQAIKAIEEAAVYGADEFSPKEIEEARDLLLRAKAYAAKRSYRKASYLARKTAELASQACENTKKARAKIEKRLDTQVNHLKKRLDMIHNNLPFDSDLSVSLADLYLRWSDIRHAIALGKYEEAEKAIHALDKDIRGFVKNNQIPIDQGNENWETTI